MGTNLKAILNAQGCKSSPSFQWICSPIQHETATFSCQPLSSITLAGRILAARSSTRALAVEVGYLSLWDHKLFGFKDGMTQGFNIGKAPLKPGGRFQIQIPEFSSDRVTIQMQDAFLEVLVVERSTGSIVELRQTCNTRASV